MTEQKQRAAIYIRVSTEGQAGEDKASLPVQRERCEAYCKAQGWEVAQVYEDGGESGAAASRPALNTMLADARAGQFQHLVFLKLDRLGRNTRNLLNISHKLDGYDVGIASVQDGFDTGTPGGRLFFTLLGAIAEFERELIMERAKMGLDAAAAKGQYTGGPPPFGYAVDPDTRRLVIDDAEAAIVQRVFRTYVQQGLSHAKLAQLLTDEGVPRRNSGGNTWYPAHIATILNNTAYIGQGYYGKTKNVKRTEEQIEEAKERQKKRRQPVGIVRAWGSRPVPKDEWQPFDCPAIIDNKLSKAAQARAKRNAKESQRPRDAVSQFLLGGLLECQPCDGGMSSYSKVSQDKGSGKIYSYRYYACNRQHRGESNCRPRMLIRAEKIEDAVFGAITSAFSDPQSVLTAARAHSAQLAERQADDAGLMEALRRNLADAQKERKRYVTLYGKGRITEAEMDGHLDRLDREVAGWQADLDRMEKAASQMAAVKEIESSAFAIAETVRENAGAMNLDERKKLVRALVEKVHVHADNALTIEAAVPGLLPENAIGEGDNGRQAALR